MDAVAGLSDFEYQKRARQLRLEQDEAALSKKRANYRAENSFSSSQVLPSLPTAGSQSAGAETFNHSAVSQAQADRAATEETRGFSSEFASQDGVHARRGAERAHVEPDQGTTGAAEAVAKKIGSKTILNTAFAYLVAVIIEPIGATLALFYLNVHYVCSRSGSKYFVEMTLYQKFLLVFANIFFGIFFVLLLFLVIVFGALAACLQKQYGLDAAIAYVTGDITYCFQ